MNDCLWAFMCDVCNCEGYSACKEYISSLEMILQGKYKLPYMRKCTCLICF